MRFIAHAAFFASAFALAFTGPLAIDRASAAGDAAKGRETFIAVGCFTCHGRSGQGGRLNYATPPLAKLQMPVEGLQVFLREPPNDMPPYAASVLSDADIADIHAFLQTLPGRTDPKAIPLLAQ